MAAKLHPAKARGRPARAKDNTEKFEAGPDWGTLHEAGPAKRDGKRQMGGVERDIGVKEKRIDAFLAPEPLASPAETFEQSVERVACRHPGAPPEAEKLCGIDAGKAVEAGKGRLLRNTLLAPSADPIRLRIPGLSRSLVAADRIGIGGGVEFGCERFRPPGGRRPPERFLRRCAPSDARSRWRAGGRPRGKGFR